MRWSNKKNREKKGAAEFEEASKLATANGLTLRPLAYADRPTDITQYRIEGPQCRWFKDIYPGNQRIYCPDKSKQGPFVAMKFGKHWGLMDVVRACIAAMAKENKNIPGTAVSSTKLCSDNLLSGNASDTRMALITMIDAIANIEGTEPQCALRDLMTDLRHVCDFKKLDYHEAEKGSYEVYLEEKADPDFVLLGEETGDVPEEEEEVPAPVPSGAAQGDLQSGGPGDGAKQPGGVVSGA